MPTKDEKRPVYLYSTDDDQTYRPVGKLTDVSEFIVLPDDTDRLIPCLNMPDMEMTVTMECRFDRNRLLILIGRIDLVPNNWLRMHGYPMRRRVQIRKARKLMRRKSSNENRPD